MIEDLVIIAGYVGRFMVLVGMTCGCILLWFLIISKIL